MSAIIPRASDAIVVTLRGRVMQMGLRSKRAASITPVPSRGNGIHYGSNGYSPTKRL